MNIDFGSIHSAWTVLMVIIFVGIVFWAYSRNRSSDFEEAANLPLNDEVPTANDQQSPPPEDKNNG